MSAEDADVVELLARTLEGQTKALVASVAALGADVRAELRSLRLWVVGLVALALILLAGVVGVSVRASLPGVDVVTSAIAAPLPEGP